MKPRDFLPKDLPELNIRIVECYHEDIGEHEEPPGSNRGRYPDMVNRESGSPLGSPWCANMVAHNWRRAGAQVPTRDAGSCDAWLKWAFDNAHVVSEPVPGAAIIYGKRDPSKPFGWDANHIGGVSQVITMPFPKPRSVVSIEGNTALIPGFEREGWIIDQKGVDLSRVVCYVIPVPR